MATLDGKKVLVITTNYGVEQDEIVVPTEQLRERGASVTVAAKETGTIQTLVGDKDPGQTLEPDTTIAGVDAKDFDALVIPGGTINADTLRQESRAATLVQAFAEASKPVAAICHGPWTLVEAGVLSGKTVTSFPSLQTDLRNAGAEWVDQEVQVDGGFITSRTPDDLPAFVDAIESALTA
ncbi:MULTISPECIES: type 1 glutamine amidotransferase domain-containing protein [Curtobacterium]|jgi:protease I|uniref:type 1 glutamine amidotransferase domain-containing protein n=1 Tax=Curtobacterium TaxID=2034 RepID=UPI000488E29F|nr:MULTISPECIES: type 1 glutamine amidotransferase domain-containing protein [Curtobacterium]MBB1195478.1 type 1 glutamine amidotransferase [Curtobacterium flaccumfaciens]MBT1605547.1 type 1 glutamine amidotransferase [Curtobacterium flaccumfaciens pv. betae]MBT1656326.1 type 1 glutamine amidotransferase [Curtobacterium flaccumfaciens pv. betae]MBT1667874.1 type 1 glutamine amidotransferase [Curtobacterium flaccumfaciens pv. flaccumfaciens]MCS0470977.1 type 1 glutamine amidotransferase [Curtob